ncbi:SDR family NAD(P)-dependent oxidoreductase [Sphingomonas sp. HITSZ_GF]|uniref:SDR family NAD(P)-dependent oxidoreductase n=1 Tax=Sphingomonas sp. HITSZ_GF TaxID=3037247 RepID=UPI00240DE0A8|nr:SDR family NAD(P)-dependent oxidoreductase [Sphingomonas sp. HITSZ_GF]MDG2533109.1 SDR family NAD(P)-dependent oxidoreductase [Sphingomonas sp. HITSZ_GF]
MSLPPLPSFRLDGKHVLVTGAGRGIGAHGAALFAQAGAAVTLCARTESEVEALAAELRGAGFQADAFALDVTDTAAVRREITARGPFDILLNNAGANRIRAITEVTEEDYDAVLNLNLKAALFVAQAVAQGLLAAGKPGSIINLSSQMGHFGGAGRSLYSASKFGLEGLTKCMAIDLAPHGIRVNTLCPTFIDTALTRPILDMPGTREHVLSRIKLGRLGQMDELSGALLLLASDASTLMTGSALMVDGGWTAG